jgi:hypothetical protein
MEIFDVVMRLNGPIDPVGDSGIDRTRLENLKALCDLTGLLFDRITAVAEATDDHMASIKAAKDCAAKFITSTTGVAPTVPADRPATLEEAQHAAEIGACLPNGVMFDYLGNPRTRYTRVSLDGAHLILDDVQLAEHKANATDPDEYTYSDVYLSQEEADALPEFDGF